MTSGVSDARPTGADEFCWCKARAMLHAHGTPCPTRSHWLDVEDSELSAPCEEGS